MNYLDYLVVFSYAAGFLLLGRMFKNTSSGEDYFLGGKSFGWFPLSLSTAATQLSAISFVSAPAFVGLKEGGGMMWLTYEFAVPIAMLFLMAFLIPPMYKAGIVSVYEFLERRFGPSTRILISVVFQFSRAFATSVMLYTIALILANVIAVPMWLTILVLGAVTLIYSYQGGMKAVVYGDVIQMIILFLGIIICLGSALSYMGGWENFIQNVDRERLMAVDFQSMGFQQGEEFGFWPMLLGGFFLYASYYGTDQSQVQRLFSAKSHETVNQTLLANGVMRFPLTFVYCLMGLVLGTFVMQQPDFMALIPADKPDLMVPIFIKEYLPHGIIGLLMVAIFSAAMSSLSSAINSLSAATVEDFFNRGKKLEEGKYIQYSKYASLFWGVTCIILAFFTGSIAKTVIEAINKIGSVFYGPILATFIAAIGIRRVNSIGANAGIIAGVGVNLVLWLFFPEVFWFWWNAIGGLVCLGVSYIVSLMTGKSDHSVEGQREKYPFDWKKAIILLVFFIFMVGFSMIIPQLF
ncbi:MAG: sodium:solute symporter [Bacteroidota bacterium]